MAKSDDKTEHKRLDIITPAVAAGRTRGFSLLSPAATPSGQPLSTSVQAGRRAVIEMHSQHSELPHQ